MNPAEPGDTRPAIGRSLFDFLVTNRRDAGAVYAVPFPFTSLVERIEGELGEHGATALGQVLIPIGRSLQRNAANPHFFNYPRVVVAVVAEGIPPAGSSGMLLKDRLYLGYQERAAVIEVISYNEAAGRFEFEIVSDYREGGDPQLRYVDRVSCIPCHQNHAPIFSRPPWDETNANTAVASRLRAVQDRFHGVPVDAGIDIPNSIDDATDRADLLSAYQRVWMDACELGTVSESVRCRADAFMLALRFRLSGMRHATGADAERTALASTLQRRWSQLWPQGLAIPNADIPNRELPLKTQNADLMDLPAQLRTDRPLTTAEIVSIASVPKPLEPFNPRAPRETWNESALASDLVDRFVSGLASFLATADVQRLDEHLFESGGNAAREYPMSCDLLPSNRDGQEVRTLTVRCRARAAAAPAPESDHPAPVVLEAYVSAESRPRSGGGPLAPVLSGTVQRLVLPGLDTLHDLDIVPVPVRRDGARSQARLELREGTAGLHARLANGNALAAIDLSWERSAQGQWMRGEAVASVSNDYAVIPAAVESMVTSSAAGQSDALAHRSFRRVALLRELFSLLQMEPIEWCCLDDAGMPPALHGDVVVPGQSPLH